MKILAHASAKKKKPKGFGVSTGFADFAHLCCVFYSMAVKGLILISAQL